MQRTTPLVTSIAVLLGAAGAASISLALWYATQFHAFADFLSYSASADRWLAGDGLYLPEQLSGAYKLTDVAGRGFVYPPPAIVPLALLTRLGPIPFVAISFVALVAGLVMIGGRRDVVAIGLTVGGLGFSIPALWAAGLGNVTIAMTALVAWAFAGRAGLLGAIGALTKLSPAMVATLDGWRGLRLAVVWTLAAVAVTLPLVGVDAWRDYLTAIANGYPNCDAAASLACGLAPLGFGVSKAITAAIGVGIGLASLAFRDRLVRLALVTCSMIALTTEFSADGPYVVYVAPLVVAMAARVTSRSSAPARQVVAEPASLSAAQEIQPAA